MKYLIFGSNLEFPRERIITLRSIREQHPTIKVVDPIETKEDAIQFITTNEPVVGLIHAHGDQTAIENLALLLLGTNHVVNVKTILCVPAIILMSEEEKFKEIILDDGRKVIQITSGCWMPSWLCLKNEWLGKDPSQNQDPLKN